MKKFVAILVAAMMLLSGLTAFAGPVEEQNAYIALMKAKMSNTDYVIRHFESIDAVDAAAFDTYFAAIDAAIKVAQTNNATNLVGAQWATILANFNAVVKALEMSYVIKVEVPTVIAVDTEKTHCITDHAACDGCECVEIPTYTVIESEWKVLTTPALIDNMNLDLKAEVDTYFDDVLYIDVAATTDWENPAVYAEPVLAYAQAAFDYGFGFEFYCEEAGVCLAQGPFLSFVNLGLAALNTKLDGSYYATSDLRTWFGNFKAAIAACAKCNPVAAAPVVDDAPAAADRLPDTATSYGNLVVAGIVMMVVAAAAVVGIKKVAFNA